jgi:hypothetical protein
MVISAQQAYLFSSPLFIKGGYSGPDIQGLAVGALVFKPCVQPRGESSGAAIL